MANPVTVSTRPQYLNVNTLIYNMWDLRRYMDGPPPGPGVFGYEDWRVQPRQSGAGLFIDVGKTGVGLMQGWVRGSTRGGQGLYRIDNIDTTAPTADTYLGQFTVDVLANVSGNPRLDLVVLEVLDAQHTGASNLAQLRVITGTPTAAATLDNRNGAAAIPPSSILLADILLASGDGTVDAVDIRDRRQFPLVSVTPPLFAAVDLVAFVPHPVLLVKTGNVQGTAATDSHQAACAMFLPRRIVNATRIRWRYQQGATANAANYILAIYDASGRKIIDTGAVAYTGAANTMQTRSETITATTFEAGWYYVFIGNAAGTVAATVASYGAFLGVAAVNIGEIGAHTANVAAIVTSGGTAPPISLKISMVDVSTLGATTLLSVPVISLSVG